MFEGLGGRDPKKQAKKKNDFFVFLFFFDFLRFLRQRPRFRAWEVFFLLTDWAISACFVFDFS